MDQASNLKPVITAHANGIIDNHTDASDNFFISLNFDV